MFQLYEEHKHNWCTDLDGTHFLFGSIQPCNQGYSNQSLACRLGFVQYVRVLFGHVVVCKKNSMEQYGLSSHNVSLVSHCESKVFSSTSLPLSLSPSLPLPLFLSFLSLALCKGERGRLYRA